MESLAASCVRYPKPRAKRYRHLATASTPLRPGNRCRWSFDYCSIVPQHGRRRIRSRFRSLRRSSYPIRGTMSWRAMRFGDLRDRNASMRSFRYPMPATTFRSGAMRYHVVRPSINRTIADREASRPFDVRQSGATRGPRARRGRSMGTHCWRTIRISMCPFPGFGTSSTCNRRTCTSPERRFPGFPASCWGITNGLHGRQPTRKSLRPAYFDSTRERAVGVGRINILRCASQATASYATIAHRRSFRFPGKPARRRYWCAGRRTLSGVR